MECFHLFYFLERRSGLKLRISLSIVTDWGPLTVLELARCMPYFFLTPLVQTEIEIDPGQNDVIFCCSSNETIEKWKFF